MGKLGNSNVAFTGFRDAELQRKIETGGGRVVSKVSKDTDVLVVAGSKGVASQKARQARALGVRVMQKDEFVQKYFEGWLARLFKGSNTTIASETCYTTLDNGGRPFKVCSNASKFWVFVAALHQKNNDDEVPQTYDKIVVDPTVYKRMFVGKSPRNSMTRFSGGYGPRFDGNSMLFELADGSYMHIGDRVKTFKAAPGDVVKRYVSPVGSSSVPYPYAEGEKYTYLMREDVRIPNAALPTASASNDDPYDLSRDTKHNKATSMRSRTIHKRLW